MKIAQFNCLQRSVPAKKSGGIEKVMDALIRGLAKRGHQITVFSTGNSKVPKGVELVSVYPDALEDTTLDELTQHKLNKEYSQKLAQELLDRQYEFDIIHNHCLAAALPIISQASNIMISTLHEALEDESIVRLSPHKHLNIVSISKSQRVPMADLNYVETIYHGIDVAKYPKPTKSKGYLVFVGRISKQKQPHLAILAAAKLKKQIIILGKFKDFDQEGEYFEKVFKPVLQANAEIVDWRGDVSEKEVMNILNKAEASLLPVSFKEPFGLAAIESMSVGCPVVAFDNGAYRETIVNGKTGFVVKDLDEMVKKLKQIGKISRKECRKHVEKNFTEDIMVENYLKLYKKMLKSKHSNADYSGTSPSLQKTV